MSEADMTCAACRGEEPRLHSAEIAHLRARLAAAWEVVRGHHLDREYRFADFRQALAFANVVGEAAEAEGHHPEILVSWGRVRVTIWTYKVDGLTASDFRLAARIDGVAPQADSTPVPPPADERSG